MAFKVATVQSLVPAVTGAFEITETGFGTPKAALLLASSGQSDDTLADIACMSIGATDGTNQNAVGSVDLHGLLTTNAARIAATDECIMLPNVGSMYAEANFTTWITDGVRLTVGAENTGVQRKLTAILFGGDDVSAKVGSIALSTQNTAVPVTSVGFEADIVFFWCHGLAMDTAESAHHILSFGVAHNDGAGTVTKRGIGIASQDNLATSETGSVFWTDGCGGQELWAGETWRLDVQDFDSSGFDVVARDGASGSDVVGYLALKFTGGNSKVVDLTYPTSTGAAAVTGIGFTPALALEAMSYNTSTDAHSATIGAGLMIGAADGTNESSVGIQSEDAQGTSDTSSIADAVLVNQYTQNGVADQKASFTSFDADGWTRNFSAATTAYKGFGVAIGTGASGRIMGSLAGAGGLAGYGGLAGQGGGLAG